jgi:hypothetical protein
MTTLLNAKSPYIAALDAIGPFVPPPFLGNGARGICKVQEDFVQVDINGLFTSVGNYARLLRILSDACIDKLEIFLDVPLDTNATSTLAFDIGIAFSDSQNNDSTPALYQGLIPTTVGLQGSLIAGTTTSFASYASPNKLFGNFNLATAAQNVNNRRIPPTDVTLNGVTSQYSLQSILSSPLVSLFNFLDGRQTPITEMGLLDLYIYCTTVAATPAAGNLGVRIFYTD